MYARVNRFSDDPRNLDDAERVAEQEIVPQLQSVPGFLGVLSLVDRTSGDSIAITFWETDQAMHASEEDAERMRGHLSQRSGSRVQAVERFEVALRVGL